MDDDFINEQWAAALNRLAEPNLSGPRPGARSAKESDQLLAVSNATEVVMQEMHPAWPDPSRKAATSLRLLLRKGLEKWTGQWLLEQFRNDLLERVIPILQDADKEYLHQKAVSAGRAVPSDWITTTFAEMVDTIHTQYSTCCELALSFDDELKRKPRHRVDPYSTLPSSSTSIATVTSSATLSNHEITIRFKEQFLAELAIRMPNSFNEIAYDYFERFFAYFEDRTLRWMHSSVQGQHGPFPGQERQGPTAARGPTRGITVGSSSVGISSTTAYSTTQQQQQQQQKQKQKQHNEWHMIDQLGANKRWPMQDGRYAMDLLVDDMDDRLVEQVFHQYTSGSQRSSKSMASASTTSTTTTHHHEEDPMLQNYLLVCSKLEGIGFASQIVTTVTRMLYQKVELKIFSNFRRKWSVPTLGEGQQWMALIVLPFLRLTLLPKNDRANTLGRKQFKMWASRLEFYFFKTFGDQRVKEFFDIIVDCPESEPAVHDLKKCIEWTGQKDQLQSSLLLAMDKRLLHPGAETTDIIDFYIFTIKYLRIFDPSGAMLDRIAQSINKYLRTRDDTMRAIVKCIVDDSNDILVSSTEGIQANMEGDEDGSDDENWVPEPISAGPDLSSARRRMADILSVLANIYDTNTLFIEAFQAILADRLLLVRDFHIDREIRQLELLKLRFGDTDLHHCEVMLADMAESKRINANIRSHPHETPVLATVASRFYWPTIQCETLVLPPKMQEMLDDYNAAYMQSRPAQKLEFMPTLGLVELEIELKDRTLSVQVPPVSAAIISMFEDKNTWSLADLSRELQHPEELLEKRVQYWVREGVLRSLGDFCYQLIE
ncbi:Anaphase-promoting complex subunit 2 [Actinomortierella ambigua]|nr:Anaphase-promoting complex subunit 2 [Actinomortierella ambigua]